MLMLGSNLLSKLIEKIDSWALVPIGTIWAQRWSPLSEHELVLAVRAYSRAHDFTEFQSQCLVQVLPCVATEDRLARWSLWPLVLIL